MSESTDASIQDAKAKIIDRMLTGDGVDSIVYTNSGETRVANFRVDNYLDMMIRKATELTYPRIQDRSELLRTAVAIFLQVFFETQDEPSIRKIMASIELEREMTDDITEERAAQDLVDRLKNLGDVISKCERNGELDRAVKLVSRQIRRIQKEPDVIRKKRHLRMFREQSIIYDVMRRSELANIPGSESAVRFIEGVEDAP